MSDPTFCRNLKPGSIGDDVIAHKRALSHAFPHLYQWAHFSNYYGPFFEAAVKRAQHQLKLSPTGQINSRTHELLAAASVPGSHPRRLAFGAYEAELARKYCRAHSLTPEERIRQAIVTAGFYWYEHRLSTGYSWYRPYWRGHPPDIPPRIDCSGFVELCWYAGGGKDPSQRGFDGQAYTGTMIDHGTRVGHLDELQPGDGIFYGWASGNTPGFPRGAPTHVSLYVGVIDGHHSMLSMGHYPMIFCKVEDFRMQLNHLRAWEVV